MLWVYLPYYYDGYEYNEWLEMNDVANIGDATGDYTVTLKMDGVTAGIKTVTLDSETSTVVSFSITTTTEGTYDVEVDVLTGSFEVAEPPPPPPIVRPPILCIRGMLRIHRRASLSLRGRSKFQRFPFPWLFSRHPENHKIFPFLCYTPWCPAPQYNSTLQ